MDELRTRRMEKWLGSPVAAPAGTEANLRAQHNAVRALLAREWERLSDAVDAGEMTPTTAQEAVKPLGTLLNRLGQEMDVMMAASLEAEEGAQQAERADSAYILRQTEERATDARQDAVKAEYLTRAYLHDQKRITAQSVQDWLAEYDGHDPDVPHEGPYWLSRANVKWDAHIQKRELVHVSAVE